MYSREFFIVPVSYCKEGDATSLTTKQNGLEPLTPIQAGCTLMREDLQSFVTSEKTTLSAGIGFVFAVAFRSATGR